MQEDEKKAEEPKKIEGETSKQMDADMSAQKIIIDRITEKKKELLEIEERIDKKTKDFQELIRETEIAGKSINSAANGDPEEEKRKKAALSLIEGTGLEKYLKL